MFFLCFNLLRYFRCVKLISGIRINMLVSRHVRKRWLLIRSWFNWIRQVLTLIGFAEAYRFIGIFDTPSFTYYDRACSDNYLKLGSNCVSIDSRDENAIVHI